MPASRRVWVLGSFMLSLNSCIAACAMVARAPWGSGGSGVHVLRLLHEAEMERRCAAGGSGGHEKQSFSLLS